jgi:hypothetical protein
MEYFIMAQSKEMSADRGPYQILCEEIGARYFDHINEEEALVSFVRVLVDVISHDMDIKEQIEPMTGVTHSEISHTILVMTKDALQRDGSEAIIKKCSEIHNWIWSKLGDEHCDHEVDMLNSCVSALRFGLEKPCKSRHAASASNHIWKKHYRVGLFDTFTSGWQKEWARAQLDKAISNQLGEF